MSGNKCKSRMATYKSLMSVDNLASFTVQSALDHISRLTDISLVLYQIDGLKRAIKLSEGLQKRQLTPGQLATLHYFLGNAWSSLRQLSRVGDQVWGWEQEEIEREITHFRCALQWEGFRELSKERQCQILTNLANLLSNVGRFVEAVEYWDRALAIIPSFPMARGNRGYGLVHYANALYDKRHKAVFFKYAHKDLKKALLSKPNKDARKIFDKHRIWIESVLPPKYLDEEIDMNSFSLRVSNQEIKYRKWCLNNRLFLNPLNDLGPYPIGTCDIFSVPSVVAEIDEGPYYHGYFNQMKQEFVSARYLYYDGTNAKRPHFSDRDVFLSDPLDYPSYSLSVEKVKTSFRMAYSLLDKTAFFLNHYLHLSIPEKKVTFRTFWYESRRKNKGLRSDFQQRQNWPLRGLFWLSKDLYEDNPDFKKSIEPDAQEFSEVRNQLEHKYLKLHRSDWPGPISKENDDSLSAFTDPLAFSMYRKEFEAKTLKLLQLVRAALIYLSLAVHREERLRAERRDPSKIALGMPLDVLEDKLKI